jgi:hypothetical protein
MKTIYIPAPSKGGLLMPLQGLKRSRTLYSVPAALKLFLLIAAAAPLLAVMPEFLRTIERVSSSFIHVLLQLLQLSLFVLSVFGK